MAKQPEAVLEEQKIFFLKNQFWQLTIAAAFSRNNIYKKDVDKKHIASENEKTDFKIKLFNYIEEIVLAYESAIHNRKIVDFEKFHIEQIIKIKVFSQKEFGDFLEKDELNFGTSQKILNLYLKYLWCANYINFEPPHFPLDRIIQGKNIKTNWTSLDDTEDYKTLINNLCSSSDKAQWELIEYNKILSNG